MTVGNILETINVITDLAAGVLAAIAGISLIVSALMIIATMYMSVAERTKEIGILRALGESKKDIRRLFTSEAVLIGLVSATLALGLAYTLGQGLLNSLLYDIAKFNIVQITTGNVIFAFVIALIISFLAALLPSRKAAKLNPIDALSAD
jgi:ABC-type antimicrobial peptide transport system permease subunit